MESIRGVLPFIQQAGSLAAGRQAEVIRSFKSDGSILTSVDRDIDAFLTSALVGLFPNAGVLSEEAPESTGRRGGWTFAVDPLDGTDCYSQGMPGWAISIGLIDEGKMPVAGVLLAPRWGNRGGDAALLFADIGAPTLLNGEPAHASPGAAESAQIMVGSTVHKHFRLERFPGKIRGVGSTVLHIVAPLLHGAVCGTLFEPNYVWDIAGAHAVAHAAGLIVEYYDGRPIDYGPLLDRKRAEGPIVAGTSDGVALIRRTVRPTE